MKKVRIRFDKHLQKWVVDANGEVKNFDSQLEALNYADTRYRGWEIYFEGRK